MRPAAAGGEREEEAASLIQAGRGGNPRRGFSAAASGSCD